MTSIENAAKWVGLAAGLAVAAVLVLSWRVSAQGGPLPADVQVTARPSGELELRPGGTFLSAPTLGAGRWSSGDLRVRNITPVPLAVRLRLSSPASLDDALRVRLDGGGERLAEGTLGALRRWSRRALRIAPGRTASVTAHVGIPTGASAIAAGGQDVDVALELMARPADGRR